MTIPIQPGPFSFLAEAGNALGEFGKAKEHNRELARKGVDTLSNLVQLGILPAETMTSKEAQHLFQVAGLPPQATVAPQPKQRRAAIEEGELNRVQPGTPAARAVSQVPSDELAGAAEGGALAQAEAEKAKAKATAAQAALQQNVNEGAMRWLGDNPQAKDLAYEVATGLMPLRIARLQTDRVNLSLERQANSDEVRLYLSALGNVSDFYRTQHAQWEKDLETATRDAGLNGLIQTDKPDQVAAFQAAFVRNRPEPQFDQIRDQYLTTQMGMNSAEFQRRLKGAMDRASNPGAPKVKGGSAVTPPPGQSAPFPQNRPHGQRTRADLGVSYLQQYIKLHGSFDEDAANNIADAVEKHKLTSVEARSILARLGLINEDDMNPIVRDLLERIHER